jgi:hypothetical protein
MVTQGDDVIDDAGQGGRGQGGSASSPRASGESIEAASTSRPHVPSRASDARSRSVTSVGRIARARRGRFSMRLSLGRQPRKERAHGPAVGGTIRPVLTSPLSGPNASQVIWHDAHPVRLSIGTYGRISLRSVVPALTARQPAHGATASGRPRGTGSAGALLGVLAALGLVAVGIAVDLLGRRGGFRIGVLVGLVLL